MYDAVVFDLDGTLIDSESLTQAAGLETFRLFGIEVEPEFLHRLIGVDDQTSAAVIHARFPQLDLMAYGTAWRATVSRHWSQGVPLKPGTVELLTAIRKPKALVTSSTRWQAVSKCCGSSSIPIPARPMRWQATKVEPDPMNGSRMVSSCRVKSRSSSAISRHGFSVGCLPSRSGGLTVWV